MMPKDIIKTKYGLTFNTDLSNSYGIHLWNNLVRVKNIDIISAHPNSLFMSLNGYLLTKSL